MVDGLSVRLDEWFRFWLHLCPYNKLAISLYPTPICAIKDPIQLDKSTVLGFKYGPLIPKDPLLESKRYPTAVVVDRLYEWLYIFQTSALRPGIDPSISCLHLIRRYRSAKN